MWRVTAILCCALFVLDANAIDVAAAEGADKANAGSVELQIVDDQGTAVPKAFVKLLSFDRDESYWKRLDRDTRSDERGAVVFGDVSTEQGYLVCARTDDGRDAFKKITFGDGVKAVKEVVKVMRPVATTIHVRDQAGRPIAGAELRSALHAQSVLLRPKTLRSCGYSLQPSDATGTLVLPALSPGELDVKVIHPDFAPGDLKRIHTGDQKTATLQPGAKVEMHFQMEPNEKMVDSMGIDLRHSRFEEPSTLIGQLPGLKPDGSATFTVATGDYSWLRLLHADFVVTPIFAMRRGKTLADDIESFRMQSGSNRVDFQMKRKVKVRGRVVRSGTNQPVVDESIRGDVHADNVQGAFKAFADEWTHADWADTNEQGEYEIQLAAGRSRVNFSGRGLIANPRSYEIDVAADGSTRAPDFIVSPMPKIRGVVQDAGGQPVPNAVVRFRGTMLKTQNPVLADDQGRFELDPPWIPVDFQTREPLESQTIVAFHPFEPLDGSAQFRWDKPESFDHIVVTLRPQPMESLISRFPEDLSRSERGIMPPADKERYAKMSLAGKPAPELDGVTWLNTGDKRRSLADYRGKYVLLQFWTTWCGPCHAEMPMVRMVERLYRDKGLVMIGVHDNSMPIEEIKKDAAKNELTYPIVADQPDGRIISSYKEHGISGFPSYVLIGPDGNVIDDDSTTPGPSLRSFMTEIVRERLLGTKKSTSLDSAK